MTVTEEPTATDGIGSRLLRREDAKLLTGEAKYVDDIQVPGQLWMGMVRSMMAHARVVSINASGALEMPGVHSVITGADIQEWGLFVGALPCAWPVTEDMANPPHWPITPDVARHVGDIVAVVLADSRYGAVDAVEQVVVEYEPLPAVANLDQAVADEVHAHPDLGTNKAFTWAIDADPDGVQAAFDAAAHTVSARFVQQRLIPAAMEPRGVLAVPSPYGGDITLHSATQVPHILKVMVAATTGIPEQKIRVIAPAVGGGFGAKLNINADEMLAVALANRLGRPVRWTETRSEAAGSTHQGRGQIQHVELAADENGKLTAIRVKIDADLGAYMMLITPGTPLLGSFLYHGVYESPKFSFTCDGWFTNCTPTDAYRGAGRPEASYLIERTVELVADELGLDPLEVRRRNFIPADAFPYATHSEIAVYDSGNYPAALDELCRIMDVDALRAEQAANRDDPTKPLLGIGFSCWLEIASFGPPGSLEGFGHLGSWESGQVRIQPDGSAIVYTGASPHGQGTVTTLAQIAADELGIGFDRISVRHGDTATVVQGIGTMGSRATAVAGESVKQAAARVVERAKVIAAHILEAAADDIEVGDDAFSVRGTPTRQVGWAEVATKSFQNLELPEGVEPGSLEATVHNAPPNFSFPSGAYGCVVEIDRLTADIRVREMYLVDDCGNVINPLLAEGQVHGGVAQGVAQALYEKMEYNADGQPLTATLIDYLVPSAPDLPEYVSGRTVTPTPNNSLGAKGIGESGSVGAPPAVVNAAVDALSHLGVRHIDMPVTPRKIFSILYGNGGDAGDTAGDEQGGRP